MFFFFSKLDNVSSPIVSQSLHYGRRMSKNHTFSCLIFKKRQKLRLNHFALKIRKTIASVCAQLGQSPLFSFLNDQK